MASRQSALILTRSFASLRSQRTSGPRAARKLRPSPAAQSEGRGTAPPDPLQKEPLPPHYSKAENSLLSTVHVPDDPNAILRPDHPAARILQNSSVVVQRELELANVLMGFEQANKYVIRDPEGNHIGFMAEEDTFGRTVGRQLLATHRPFTTHVFDRHQEHVLTFKRPFALINSRIQALDTWSSNSGGNRHRVIGEAHQQWHAWRRKYNLFLNHNPPTSSFDPESGGPDPEHQFTQFAYVDEGLLSWDFSLLSANNALLGSVNRNFRGFAREIFTDTGNYALRMDAASLAEEPRHLISNTGRTNALEARDRGMTLDERAVMLATAVSIDFDYFSRHSGHGGFGFFPYFDGGFRDSGVEASDRDGAVVPTNNSNIPDIPASSGSAGGLGTGAIAGAAMGSHGWNADQQPQSPAPNVEEQQNKVDPAPGLDIEESEQVWGDATSDSWWNESSEQQPSSKDDHLPGPPDDSGNSGLGGGDIGGDGDWGDWF